MDRGYVFKLINSYMDKFNPGDPKTLYDYKFVFLQIICSHEHYIAFNLPLLYPRLGTTSRTGELLYEAFLCHKYLSNFLNPEDSSLVGCDVSDVSSGVTSQKNGFFSSTAVRTSHLTRDRHL